MVYFNYISMGLICVFILLAALIKRRRPLSERFTRLIESRRFELIFVSVLLLGAAALRLIGLSELPAGMNQDEASIGYDSWAIANYGVDRNGYHNPVYPVAWGAGHGPFYMYAASLFIKLFGNSLFVYRLPQALLGVLSVSRAVRTKRHGLTLCRRRCSLCRCIPTPLPISSCPSC